MHKLLQNGVQTTPCMYEWLVFHDIGVETLNIFMRLFLSFLHSSVLKNSPILYSRSSIIRRLCLVGILPMLSNIFDMHLIVMVSL